MSNQESNPGNQEIPVMQPQLPTAEALSPYLKRIDENRFYSNFGPLLQELHEKLAHHFNTPTAFVTSACNATLGLWACFEALPAKGEAWMPAWTFSATPSAAMNANLSPVFLDVDPTTWALTPDIAANYLYKAKKKPAVIVPVSPFGAPLPYAEWKAFHKETNIPIIIDAAAGFDTIQCFSEELPFFCTVLSLHATKPLAASEGGVIFCHNNALQEKVKTYTNFGFCGASRESQRPGLNAKLSEYAAAIALSALDQWPKSRQALITCARWYQEHLPTGWKLQSGLGNTWVSSSCVVQSAVPFSSRTPKMLHIKSIHTRQWYEAGCHKMPAFQHCDQGNSLKNTDYLASTTLGLPFYPDIPLSAVQYVSKSLDFCQSENLKEAG